MSAEAVRAGANGAASAAEFDMTALLGADGRAAEPRWAKVLDPTRCIACRACTMACRSENEVPPSGTRTTVESADDGTFPQARRTFRGTLRNQCEAAPCAAARRTSAMYRCPDGIVDVDEDACIGCRACIAGCGYEAISVEPEDHSAEKCNVCAHRLDVGVEREPARV